MYGIHNSHKFFIFLFCIAKITRIEPEEILFMEIPNIYRMRKILPGMIRPLFINDLFRSQKYV